MVFVSASEKEKIDLNFALPTTTIPENIFVKKKKKCLFYDEVEKKIFDFYFQKP